ncbi:hypothetical protein [Pseudomonas sp.]|uniref:hypothetical protein n=1 Tax=Pseudomonas sp. TaxID=306 RepID=UPI003CC6029D
MISRYLYILFLLPSCALAKSSEPEPVKLVNACKELIAMYDRDGQENKLVSWFGSVSEGMQAGYCRGVIVEYRRHDDLRAAEHWSSHERCNQPDWFSQAQKVASYPATSASQHSVASLLEASCGR